MPSPMFLSIAWPYLLAALAFGYALGSIPFGLLLTRAAGLGDIRKVGSGNIGATNVLRTGQELAAATLLLDAAKGLVAVLIAGQLAGPDAAIAAARSVRCSGICFRYGWASRAARAWPPHWGPVGPFLGAGRLRLPRLAAGGRTVSLFLARHPAQHSAGRSCRVGPVVHPDIR